MGSSFASGRLTIIWNSRLETTKNSKNFDNNRSWENICLAENKKKYANKDHEDMSGDI